MIAIMHSHILLFLQGCFTTLILCATEVLHQELCVYTLCELICNEQHYLQLSIVSLLDASGYIQSKNALPATSESFERA